jgi:DNA-binding response OmpR family regulator
VALRDSGLTVSASELVFDGIVVNFEKMEVIQNGTSVALTTGEFRTLQFFVQNADRIITPTELLNEVCDLEDEDPTARSIDNHIMKLRQKLEDDPSRPTHFRTIPRLGYRFAF